MTQGITCGNTYGMYVVAKSITPAAVLTITAVEQTFTVSGVKTGDAVIVSPPGTQSGAIVGACRVTAANTVGITFVNPTVGSVTPTAGTHVFTIFRPSGGVGASSVGD